MGIWCEADRICAETGVPGILRQAEATLEHVENMAQIEEKIYEDNDPQDSTVVAQLPKKASGPSGHEFAKYVAIKIRPQTNGRETTSPQGERTKG